jgi:pseudomonalisin
MKSDRTHSRSLTIGSAALATLLCTTGITALASSASATSGWSPTATKALNLLNAEPSGAAGATRVLHLTIGLTPRNQAGLTALIRRQATPGSADYDRYLTPAQFTANFAATKASATAVSRYLNTQGLTHVSVAKNRLQVTASATVQTAEKAFHTSISRFVQGGRTILANTAAAQVPTALAGKVSAVLGLSTLTMSAAPSVSLPKLTGYYPTEFRKIYDTGSTTPGTGTTLAVIAEGNLAPTIKDLRLAETKQGLPQVPVSLVYSGVKSTDVSGADEWDLDTQTSTGVAAHAKRLYIYVSTSLTDSDLARSLNDFAAQDVAKSGSASLGECDALPFADGAMTVDDMIFAEAAAQGQTFFASSGDTGSACAVLPTNGVPGAGAPDTEYPASSPYVLGVGGTTLDTNANDRYQAEISWNAGGGGVSPVETSPYWQSGAVPTAAAGLRGVPDVAFDADPDTGALIYVNGAAEAIGGTSLASPLALGLWTRIQASHANKLGFAAPKLYALYTKAQAGSPLPPASVPGFHDIVAGVNGIYTALPGYDYTTGLGSWDVAALSKALK